MWLINLPKPHSTKFENQDPSPGLPDFSVHDHTLTLGRLLELLHADSLSLLKMEVPTFSSLEIPGPQDGAAQSSA